MNIDNFKKRLLDKERELLADIGRLEAAARDLAEPDVRDATDDATSAQSVSESLQEAALASRTLTEVRDALKRIEDGTYGQCLDGDRPIEPARLEAIPWAAYCLADQEKHDQETHVAQGGSTL